MFADCLLSGRFAVRYMKRFRSGTLLLLSNVPSSVCVCVSSVLYFDSMDNSLQMCNPHTGGKCAARERGVQDTPCTNYVSKFGLKHAAAFVPFFLVLEFRHSSAVSISRNLFERFAGGSLGGPLADLAVRPKVLDWNGRRTCRLFSFSSCVVACVCGLPPAQVRCTLHVRRTIFSANFPRKTSSWSCFCV